MTLNDRDFNSITKEESLLWDAVKEQEKVIINGEPNLLLKKTLYRQYPKAVRHFLSLFPNNFIDAVDLINESEIFKKKLQDFNNLLENYFSKKGGRLLIEQAKSPKDSLSKPSVSLYDLSEAKAIVLSRGGNDFKNFDNLADGSHGAYVDERDARPEVWQKL